MKDHEKIVEAVQSRLETVIDPETGTNVVHMRLVRDLQVDANGKVTYLFQPSSPLCPIATSLAMSIIEAIHEVPGVSEQDMQVIGYVYADELNALLKPLFSKTPDK
jgi:metal-sulfur cluster biosynthetic enzyme